MTSEKVLLHLQRVHDANRGKKRTPEQRARISAGCMGRTIGQEQRNKISASLSGRPGMKHTPESRAKISASRKTSPEAQAQLKALHEAKRGKPAWNRGKHLTDEHKKKLSISNINQHKNLDYRNSLSENAKIRCADPIYREELSKRTTKYYAEHPEARDALSKRVTQQMANPAARARLSECHLKDKNPMWKNGSSFLPYCPKFNPQFKENVRAFFGGKCVICGKNHEENGKKLSVHHVFTEKMACCESKIEEMSEVRKRLPSEIARFEESEFANTEVDYIRMMVPLCKQCHGKMIREEIKETPYNETKYRKFFAELIINQYAGKCFCTPQ